ncbi:MAG TPA: hypothetical protein VMR86_03100 [Myxococcota bacterium]|nr:hypothetical protein [Myxococcota bacterium]
MVRRIVLGLAGSVALAACAPPHQGFFQFAEIPAPPERACVREVAQSVADPGSVSERDERGDWIVEYLRGGTRYGMQVSPRGTPPFFAHYGWAERDAPVALLGRMRDQMREVTLLVQSRCGVTDLAKRVKEQCAGVHCPELGKPGTR